MVYQKRYLGIISNIYKEREFLVSDHGHTSAKHPQHFGISQGCPLSPFLFVMVMTVLLHDANTMLEACGVHLTELCCNELVYADDTLLIGVSAQHIQKYMECIADVGKEYGLSLNWQKLEQINVNCDDKKLCSPAGEDIHVKKSMKYLGAQLAADGHIESEVAQKLGAAAQVFKSLKRIWNHCSISRSFKYVVFTACVIQKLLYSLDGAWLNKAVLKSVDGFYCKCLRQILKISPSFISRVSNQYILKQFKAIPLSRTLLQRQLLLFGKITRLPGSSVVRASVFAAGSNDLANQSGKRAGRPRNTWAAELSKQAHQLAGGRDLNTLLANRDKWKTEVRQFVRQA